MGYPAASYERYSVPGLFAPWASRLARIADPRPGQRILDVACGTGIVARTVAQVVGTRGTVVGLDLDPDMIGTGRAAAERESVAIEWRTGRAEQLPFADGGFDTVICQFGLMFFADRRAALTEMHRVLRPGGRVVVSVWQGLDRHPFHRALDEASRRHLGRSCVEKVFSLGDADVLRELLTTAGFQGVEIESGSITARHPDPEEFLAWELDSDPAETPALRDLDLEDQAAVLAALQAELRPALREVTVGCEVVMPSHAHLAYATP